jgi:hypothetical protein
MCEQPRARVRVRVGFGVGIRAVDGDADETFSLPGADPGIALELGDGIQRVSPTLLQLLPALLLLLPALLALQQLAGAAYRASRSWARRSGGGGVGFPLHHVDVAGGRAFGHRLDIDSLHGHAGVPAGAQ